MDTTRGPFHPTRFSDVAVTVAFHCNSACRFCIVQEGMNRYQGLPLERFTALVDENLRSAKYQRVVFTGGEVTLEKNLSSYVRYARDSGAFRYLRLQTNARRLADPEFTASLVADGINEFFVSVHGHDAASHDDITQRVGSFDELVAGLGHLRDHDVRVITNTVMTRRNVRSLPQLVDLAAEHGVSRMEFWNYLPMEDQEDQRDLIAPLDELLPPLLAALDSCAARSIPAVTKYVPRCQLGRHAAVLDNSQPDTIIVESFWDQFPHFNCLYEARCEHSEACLGLQHAYVNKFGWEEARLVPAPRVRPWVEREKLVEGTPERYHSGDSGHPAWEALTAGELPAGCSVEQVQLTRNQARYQLRCGDASVDLVLSARDERAAALARSRTFNIFYTNLEGTNDDAARSTVKELLGIVASRIVERDVGELTLDARKGLLQVLPPERRTR